MVVKLRQILRFLSFRAVLQQRKTNIPADATPPIFVEKFQSVAVRDGDPVTLRAKASGKPVPTLHWLKDNAPLVASPNIQITAGNGETTLVIQKARFEDAGWYTCNATNAAGTFSLRGNVTVSPKLTPHKHVQQIRGPTDQP